MFSCVIGPSSVTLIIPPERRAEMWARRGNINGLCDITVPAHSKATFYYIMAHQQVISHHSPGSAEVNCASMQWLHAAAPVPIRLIQ